MGVPGRAKVRYQKPCRGLPFSLPERMTMRPAPYTVGFLAAALLFIAAVLTVIAGGTPLWQPIALFAASALFLGAGVYSRRRWKRSTP